MNTKHQNHPCFSRSIPQLSGTQPTINQLQAHHKLHCQTKQPSTWGTTKKRVSWCRDITDSDDSTGSNLSEFHQPFPTWRWNKIYDHLVIEYSHGRSPFFNRWTIYKWTIFHGYVSLPERVYIYICMYIYIYILGPRLIFSKLLLIFSKLLQVINFWI